MRPRIAPIQTEYRSVLFRSRLEADWARCFDEHGVKWAYEPQGFNLLGIAYLPDFWLPELCTVVEVKGVLDGQSDEKVRRMAMCADPVDVLVVLAEAPAGERWIEVNPHLDFIPTHRHDRGLAPCPACGAWQFMVTGCRRCSHRERLPDLTPFPFKGRLSERLRWHALRAEAEGAADAARLYFNAADDARDSEFGA